MHEGVTRPDLPGRCRFLGCVQCSAIPCAPRKRDPVLCLLRRSRLPARFVDQRYVASFYRCHCLLEGSRPAARMAHLEPLPRPVLRPPGIVVAVPRVLPTVQPGPEQRQRLPDLLVGPRMGRSQHRRKLFVAALVCYRVLPMQRLPVQELVAVPAPRGPAPLVPPVRGSTPSLVGERFERPRG